MSYVVDDAVLETSAVTGTGTVTVLGAVTGCKALSTARRSDGSAIQVGDIFPYAIWGVDSAGNRTGEQETGLGTLASSTTFTRSVLGSSNSDALVSFSAGTKYVAISAIAMRILQRDNEGAILVPQTSATFAPVAAPASAVKLFAQSRAGRVTPGYIGPTGAAQAFQDKLSEGNGVIYLPNNGTTVGLNLGLAWTSGGTVSHPTPASTNVYTQQKRTRWANVVTTADQVLGLRTAAAEKCFWRGNGARLGGFNFHARFAVGLWAAASVRLFVGLTDSTTGVVASNTVAGSACGFWHDAADAATVLSFMTRNNATTTKTSVGTLAASLAAGQTYDAWIWCAPNDSTIYYRLVELNTNTLIVEGSTTTTLPVSTAMMGPELAMSNGANTTVTTTAFELMRMSCQSDL